MQEFRQQHGRSGERYWQIELKPDAKDAVTIVASAWGAIKDNKHRQHGKTEDMPGPKGKENTKAWVSAEENALFVCERLIRKKTEEGYVEVGLDGRPLVGSPLESPSVINFAEPLPKNLCFSKPLNSIKEARARKLFAVDPKTGLPGVICTRKINGMMVIAQTSPTGKVLLYTRRMDDLTSHFPHLVVAMHDLDVPHESVFLFEAFLGEGNTQAEFDKVGGIMRSKPDRAIKLQEDEGWMSFYLFRVPVLGGRYMEQENTCEQQICAIENSIADRFLDYLSGDYPEAGRFLHILEVCDLGYDEALSYAAEQGYEGWVCYVRDGCFEDRSFSFHGKPDRPSCCFKLKVEFEDDFICYFNPNDGTKEKPLGYWGTGKNSKRVGTMSLYQYGEGKTLPIYICEVGSGLSDEERDELVNASFPLVVEVKFQARKFKSRGDKSNALTHPRVVRFRDDKEESECVNPKLTS